MQDTNDHGAFRALSCSYNYRIVKTRVPYKYYVLLVKTLAVKKYGEFPLLKKFGKKNFGDCNNNHQSFYRQSFLATEGAVNSSVQVLAKASFAVSCRE